MQFLEQAISIGFPSTFWYSKANLIKHWKNIETVNHTVKPVYTFKMKFYPMYTQDKRMYNDKIFIVINSLALRIERVIW